MTASPVERYLDEMFDRLAGTGPAGRRMLAETESHLHEAVAEGIAAGLDADAAERAAIERFGPVAGVARLVPVTGPGVREVARRMITGTWVVTGIVLTWYGISGIVTWLVGWPWTRLLLATDRFGTQPGMCNRPWVPADPTVDWFTRYREQLNVVPSGGDQFPYPWVAVAGVFLLVLWRMTTKARTPAPVPLGLGLAVPFGLGAAVLMFYGIVGLTGYAQAWAPSYLIAGLLAAVVSAAAVRRTRVS